MLLFTSLTLLLDSFVLSLVFLALFTNSFNIFTPYLLNSSVFPDKFNMYFALLSTFSILSARSSTAFVVFSIAFA